MFQPRDERESIPTCWVLSDFVTTSTLKTVHLVEVLGSESTSMAAIKRRTGLRSPYHAIRFSQKIDPHGRSQD